MTMALDLWSHQFCLACDRQVESDGAAYCSEACRLTEFERTSSVSSQASSPGLTPSSDAWSPSSTRQLSGANGFFLPPAYDFNKARPNSTAPIQHSLFGHFSFGSSQTTKSTLTATDMLTPSSSNSSLSSMGSTSSNGDASQLSDRARQELQAYAVSFDHVRTQRRRSY